MMVAAADAAPAPRLAITTLAELHQPLPLPYNERANGMRQLAAARHAAVARHRLLLVDLGGNWCLDCRLLAAVMAQPALAPFLSRHYEVVSIDVGRFDRNLGVPAHYGITARLAGVPNVLIVDPRRDRLLNPGHTAALADARSVLPQAIADWLASWV